MVSCFGMAVGEAVAVLALIRIHFPPITLQGPSAKFFMGLENALNSVAEPFPSKSFALLGSGLSHASPGDMTPKRPTHHK